MFIKTFTMLTVPIGFHHTHILTVIDFAVMIDDKRHEDSNPNTDLEELI